MLGEIFNLEKVQSFCETVCFFVGVNFMFLVSNLPLLLFCFLVGISRAGIYYYLFLLCLLPMAPALAAVFWAMNRLLKKEDGGGIRDFCRGYRRNFLPALKVGAVQALLLFLTRTNLVFFRDGMPVFPVYVFSLLLFALTVLLTPILYLLVARYELSVLAVYKTAVILEIGRPVFTLGDTAALGLILMAFELAPGPAVVFMGSAYGFLIVFMNQRMLQKFERQEAAQS